LSFKIFDVPQAQLNEVRKPRVLERIRTIYIGSSRKKKLTRPLPGLVIRDDDTFLDNKTDNNEPQIPSFGTEHYIPIAGQPPITNLSTAQQMTTENIIRKFNKSIDASPIHPCQSCDKLYPHQKCSFIFTAELEAQL